MARGLAWLPLLVLFFGLAWAGWNEYRKLEAYKAWAQQFERAKYDIYAALGQKGNLLTWGKPTRKGVVNIETIDLTKVNRAVLEIDAKPIEPSELPSKGKVSIGFDLENGDRASIPFTEGDMACQWLQFLQTQLSAVKPSDLPA